MQFKEVPMIDMAPLYEAGASDRQAVIEVIGQACEEIGFLYVKNHSLPAELIAAARAQARAFFDLPMAEKRKIERPRGLYRGYIPTMPFSKDEVTGEDLLYEAFLCGEERPAGDPVFAESGQLISPNLWPENPPAFAPTIKAYYEGVTGIANTLIRAFGEVLAGDPELLTPHFTRPMTNISVLHYLPRSRAPEQGSQAGAHHDTNALTILLPGEVGGLQVLRRDGQWIDAPPIEGAFVVNLGNMMEAWSGGRFVSTKHRVHPPAGVDRYSIAYFTSPNHDCLVEPVLPPAEGQNYPPLDAGRDFARFVAQFDA